MSNILYYHFLIAINSVNDCNVNKRNIMYQFLQLYFPE